MCVHPFLSFGKILLNKDTFPLSIHLSVHLIAATMYVGARRKLQTEFLAIYNIIIINKRSYFSSIVAGNWKEPVVS